MDLEALFLAELRDDQAPHGYHPALDLATRQRVAGAPGGADLATTFEPEVAFDTVQTPSGVISLAGALRTAVMELAACFQSIALSEISTDRERVIANELLDLAGQ